MRGRIANVNRSHVDREACALAAHQTTRGMLMENEKPIHEIALGRIRVAIWKNVTEQGSVWFSVTATRFWKSAERTGNSTSFGHDDLPVVAKGMDMAYAWIWEYEASAPRQSVNE
jgi:hypothetical protein